MEIVVATVAQWPEAAVQTSEKISTQRPALPDLGSHSRLERHRSPWAIRAAILQHIEWLLWSRIGGLFESNTQGANLRPADYESAKSAKK